MQRYECWDTQTIDKNDLGEWCKWEDVANLVERVKVLESALKDWVYYHDDKSNKLDAMTAERDRLIVELAEARNEITKIRKEINEHTN